MRRFSSYGPVNPKIHYYAPRKELIETGFTQLVGENPMEGGHYITVWAPRQCGKTWVMQEVLFKLRKDDRFDVLKINLEHLKEEKDVALVLAEIAREIGEGLGKDFTGIDSGIKFQHLFKKGVLDKPLILIFDEFDALEEKSINTIVSTFRNIYIKRRDEPDKPTEQKYYLLHAVALIGVRSVLGIENVKGSPFNVQRSLHIPDLTYDEVKEMFRWYERESGQKIEDAVIDRLFYETRGQPGLTCWFGELLCEGFEEYTNDTSRPIGMPGWEEVYEAATYILPNNNILNIISKAKEEENRDFILKLFQTDKKFKFRYDNPVTNALYMNGVVSREKTGDAHYYIRFSCPFVQKRLFNYFSDTLFNQMGQLLDPFTDLDTIMTPTLLDIRELMKLYQIYLDTNRSWLFKDVPRRSDMRVYEAVFHFNLYAYLDKFLPADSSRVLPEFPTGNGKIDLLIEYNDMIFGIELKSFTHRTAHQESLAQAARYGKQLQLSEIYLITFIETIDEKNRKTFEVDYRDAETGVTVKPIFIQTGKP